MLKFAFGTNFQDVQAQNGCDLGELDGITVTEKFDLS